jgi:hypothetical protein
MAEPARDFQSQSTIMNKSLLVASGVFVILALVAIIVDIGSENLWKRRVWSCYEALGSGDRQLKPGFRVPPPCQATGTFVVNLGAPDAKIVFVFQPPQTMWLSYLMKTADYDSYAIELHTDKGVTRAHMHHGSD